MANVTISDLEQIAELFNSLKIPCEGDTGNTSVLTLSQLLDFLHAPVQVLSLSGASPTYTVNATRNVVHTLDLSVVNAGDTVTINLPAGLTNKESQVIVKIKNPNLATIKVAGLTKRVSQFNLGLPNFQLILDYDQTQGAWVGGTLQIENV